MLLSWIALNNDPTTTDPKTGITHTGPTLTLLTDEASPYQHTFDVAVFFVQTSDRARRVFRMLKERLASLCPGLAVESVEWAGSDPTDYQALFAFLSEVVPALRTRFAGDDLFIHISPGTPAMQTLWVLMAETGYVEGPLTLVKTLRARERGDRPAAQPVSLGLTTLLKSFRAARPAHVSGEAEAVAWDPAQFRSEALRSLYERARRIAQLRVPVLLLGERGTGKTTLASWIRNASPYRKKKLDAAWPSVACGQYTSEMMRSELFGHKKGAFTGAIHDRDGLLHRADGDTLFLDEIGDVSRDLQRLLIRAIEEGTYLPLGAQEPETSTFRLICATNLPDDVVRERLDPDFLDRIGLFQLRLPALREIPEDLPWLWRSAYRQALERSGRRDDVPPLGEPHHAAIAEHLSAYPLPGNMRDLLRVAYRLIAARVPLAGAEPLSDQEAVAFALAEAERRDEGDLARRLAGAFARREPLGPIVRHEGRLGLDATMKSFQRYLASELLRYAKQSGEPVEGLSDKGKSTLYAWRSDAEGQQPSS